MKMRLVKSGMWFRLFVLRCAKGSSFRDIGWLALALVVVAPMQAKGDTGWYQDYVLMDVNGTTDNYFWIGADPSYGTQFHGHDFGEVTNLVITGCDMRYWSDTQDRTGGSYFWKVDGGAETEVVWSQAHLGGNDYQGTSSTDQHVLAGLSAGPHKLEVRAKSWGTGQGDSWLDNGGNNYTSSFTLVAVATVSPSSGPLAGGNGVLITNCNAVLGDASDITNIVLGGVGTTDITGQGSHWVAFVAPASSSAGMREIVIQSTSAGDTTLANAYTVNPAGAIGGVEEDWTQWQEVAGLPLALSAQAAGVLNGHLYVAGGIDASDATRTNVYRFDGAAWTEVEGLPSARQYPAGAADGTGLYVAGGAGAGDSRTNVYRFNGTTWSNVAGLPQKAYSLAADVLDGKLIVAGGYDGITIKTNVYELDSGIWSEQSGLPAARRDLAAATWSNAFYVLGGSSGSAQPTVYRFNGTTWSATDSLPAARYGLTAGVLDGKLYAAGGNDAAARTNVYRYDGASWEEAPGLPDARFFHASAVLNGALYVVGGVNDAWTRQTNVYRYPKQTVDFGVSPNTGASAGGYQVTITGSNLGNGSDITNVTLAGVAATNIASQSATQVVVWAGSTGSGTNGDVRVFSTSFGETVKSNAFTYESPTIVVLYDFYMQAVNGDISVCWQTASEEDTVGFDLYRWDGSEWVKVNATFIPGTGEMGGSYCVADPAASATDTYRYKLVEKELYGEQVYEFDDISVRNPRMENISVMPAGVVLRWLSREQDTYEVQRTLNLMLPLEAIATGLPATPTVNVYTDQVESANGAFYRIRVE